ncbi:cytochrome P450 family protein [Streptomyces coffeae]|uniref:Cytochrome P450 n=1 Tax=Streptomyces coffeae TaxID=621382 RepID=A0ABS1NGQ7_9ACTN|nr:cytochrome P450 [Streptomyces coffeae]MBL1099273.1 cytochrome P450 [Streptomyces coffeae]
MPPSRDPLPLDALFTAEPHASYAALRRVGPVHQAIDPDGTPLVLVTSYQAVRDAAMDPRLSVDKRHARAVAGHRHSMPAELDAHLLNSDPPAHTRLRRLVSSALTPRRTENLRAAVQRTTDRLLDEMAVKDHADVMADLALPLSLSVICDLLGIPAHSRLDFRRWTDTLLSSEPGAPEHSRKAMREMHRFLAELIDSKRGALADDLLSALITARDAGDRLSEDELIAMAFLLLFGGYHNSASLLATTVLALLTHPHHLAAVRTGELPIDAVAEEALRWNPPAMLAVRRFATEDIRIGGTAIPAGERVWLSWASANRDPARFRDPATFDPHRADVGAHLAFGHGPHYCPGAALARMENNIAVASLIRRFPRLSLVGSGDALEWVASLRSRSLRELPVSL